MPLARPLEPVLERAGAMVSNRHGHRVVAHYGSAAGELAVCVRAVGLVDRSELSLLDVRAPAQHSRDALARLVGTPLARGGVVSVGGAWWCRESDERVLVLSPHRVAARLEAQLAGEAYRSADFHVEDRSQELAAIGVLGHAAPALLKRLGAFGPAGDPRLAAPFGRGRVAGVELRWLLASDQSALALVDAAAAQRVWRAIEQAGRPLGLSCVGLEAVERYSLLARRRD